jgi:hypothetical protein
MILIFIAAQSNILYDNLEKVYSFFNLNIKKNDLSHKNKTIL